MGEDRSEIEREISAERRALDRHLTELQDRANELRDWRVHYRRHPGLAIGLAFGSGVVLAAAMGGSARRTRREPDRWLERDARDRAEPSAFRTQVTHQVQDFWQRAASALLSLASAKAVDFVATRVPGFREEFDRCDEASPRMSESIH